MGTVKKKGNAGIVQYQKCPNYVSVYIELNEIQTQI